MILIDKDIENILRLCCKIVKEDIKNNVKRRKAIDGGPQKANAVSTVRKKGHNWQLRHRYDGFLDDTTYKISVYNDRAVIEFDYPVNKYSGKGGGRLLATRNVGILVENKGYYFWGISENAAAKCQKLIRGWFYGTIVPKIKTDLMRGLKNDR